MAPHPRPRHIATLGYLTLAAVDSYLAGREGRSTQRARQVTKPLLMPLLAVTTQLQNQHEADPLTRRVQLAQLFSWGGDVALLGHTKPRFLVGVASFLVAHLFYIAGFRAVRVPGAKLASPGVVIAGATWATTAPGIAVAAGRQDPALRVPVAAYSAVLSTMFATSTMLDHTIAPVARRKIVAGTSLFLLSDTLLGVQKFLRHDGSRKLETAVMATYTAGQYVIAQGAAGRRGASEH